MSLVSVVVPVYKEFNSLSSYEKISLLQCLRVLYRYPIIIVAPRHLDLRSYEKVFAKESVEFRFKKFSNEYLSGIGGYSRLLLSPKFYRAFLPSEYILIYQTDVFVFNDVLEQWCSRDIDYVGAPWFEKFSFADPNAPMTGVGNGGFSLRRVKSHLNVLHSFSYLSDKTENWRSRMSQQPRGLRWLKQAVGFGLDQVVRNNTFWLLNSFRGFEDQFWSIVVPKNFPWFRIPDIDTAMKFSIEMQPRRVFELNNRELPFGCHAWWKYDLEFWKPHIEKFGYQL